MAHHVPSACEHVWPCRLNVSDSGHADTQALQRAWIDLIDMLFGLAMSAMCTLGIRQLAHALILRGLRAPRTPHLQTPEDQGYRCSEVQLTTARGQLFAWFVPANSTDPSPAVVVMHGWGANASLMLPALQPLHAAGYSVLLVDALCHGLSDGAAFTSLPRFAVDIARGLDWLQRQPSVDSTRLAILGHSVGAGAALLCATGRRDVRAVISMSAFAHPQDIMRRFLQEARIPYPLVGWFVMQHVQRVIGAQFDDIAPVNSIRQLHCPVLLVHGTEDSVVPVSDLHRLMQAGAAGQVQCLCVRGGHDPSAAFEAADLLALTDFLNQAFDMAHGSTDTQQAAMNI